MPKRILAWYRAHESLRTMISKTWFTALLLAVLGTVYFAVMIKTVGTREQHVETQSLVIKNEAELRVITAELDDVKAELARRRKEINAIKERQNHNEERFGWIARVFSPQPSTQDDKQRNIKQ